MLYDIKKNIIILNYDILKFKISNIFFLSTGTVMKFNSLFNNIISLKILHFAALDVGQNDNIILFRLFHYKLVAQKNGKKAKSLAQMIYVLFCSQVRT